MSRSVLAASLLAAAASGAQYDCSWKTNRRSRPVTQQFYYAQDAEPAPEMLSFDFPPEPTAPEADFIAIPMYCSEGVPVVCDGCDLRSVDAAGVEPALESFPSGCLEACRTHEACRYISYSPDASGGECQLYEACTTLTQNISGTSLMKVPESFHGFNRYATPYTSTLLDWNPTPGEERVVERNHIEPAEGPTPPANCTELPFRPVIPARSFRECAMKCISERNCFFFSYYEFADAAEDTVAAECLFYPCVPFEASDVTVVLSDEESSLDDTPYSGLVTPPPAGTPPGQLVYYEKHQGYNRWVRQSNLASWGEAKAMCQKFGMRLCTGGEVCHEATQHTTTTTITTIQKANGETTTSITTRIHRKIEIGGNRWAPAGDVGDEWVQVGDAYNGVCLSRSNALPGVNISLRWPDEPTWQPMEERLDVFCCHQERSCETPGSTPAEFAQTSTTRTAADCQQLCRERVAPRRCEGYNFDTRTGACQLFDERPPGEQMMRSAYDPWVVSGPAVCEPEIGWSCVETPDATLLPIVSDADKLIAHFILTLEGPDTDKPDLDVEARVVGVLAGWQLPTSAYTYLEDEVQSRKEVVFSLPGISEEAKQQIATMLVQFRPPFDSLKLIDVKICYVGEENRCRGAVSGAGGLAPGSSIDMLTPLIIALPIVCCILIVALIAWRCRPSQAGKADELRGAPVWGIAEEEEELEMSDPGALFEEDGAPPHNGGGDVAIAMEEGTARRGSPHKQSLGSPRDAKGLGAKKQSSASSGESNLFTRRAGSPRSADLSQGALSDRRSEVSGVSEAKETVKSPTDSGLLPDLNAEELEEVPNSPHELKTKKEARAKLGVGAEVFLQRKASQASMTRSTSVHSNTQAMSNTQNLVMSSQNLAMSQNLGVSFPEHPPPSPDMLPVLTPRNNGEEESKEGGVVIPQIEGPLFEARKLPLPPVSPAGKALQDEGGIVMPTGSAEEEYVPLTQRASMRQSMYRQRESIPISVSPKASPRASNPMLPKNISNPVLLPPAQGSTTSAAAPLTGLEAGIIARKEERTSGTTNTEADSAPALALGDASMLSGLGARAASETFGITPATEAPIVPDVSTGPEVPIAEVASPTEVPVEHAVPVPAPLAEQPRPRSSFSEFLEAGHRELSQSMNGRNSPQEAALAVHANSFAGPPKAAVAMAASLNEDRPLSVSKTQSMAVVRKSDAGAAPMAALGDKKPVPAFGGADAPQPATSGWGEEGGGPPEPRQQRISSWDTELPAAEVPTDDVPAMPEALVKRSVSIDAGDAAVGAGAVGASAAAAAAAGGSKEAPQGKKGAAAKDDAKKEEKAAGKKKGGAVKKPSTEKPARKPSTEKAPKKKGSTAKPSVAKEKAKEEAVKKEAAKRKESSRKLLKVLEDEEDDLAGLTPKARKPSFAKAEAVEEPSAGLAKKDRKHSGKMLKVLMDDDDEDDELTTISKPTSFRRNLNGQRPKTGAKPSAKKSPARASSLSPARTGGVTSSPAFAKRSPGPGREAPKKPGAMLDVEEPDMLASSIRSMDL
eukprot:TRINITY_DN653_c0_g1_i1.p1 TRINITY_DN653_c0_g1~~TRINITY_DN653_c0_g1_i1.p1  ORF type:complete len:1527 (+),score=559.68 TRINITY_DN653_c0_g1_i1:100-4680(+)